MPRSFSIAIQSEVTPRRPALPCTAPAVLIAAACSASASVSVDLPASGWLITANVRRRRASSSTPSFRTTPLIPVRLSTSVTDTAAALLTQRDIPDSKQGKVKIYSPNDAGSHAHRTTERTGAGDRRSSPLAGPGI